MSQRGCLVARDVIISCMDLRTQLVRRRLIDHLKIEDGTFDLVSVPGGAGDFRQLERCLGISRNLHGTREVILMVHEDCGAGAKKCDLLQAAKIALKLGLNYRAFYLFRKGEEWTWEEVLFSEEELLSKWKWWWRKIISAFVSRRPIFEEE